MSWLVVTPAFNEAARLPRLAASLAGQRLQPVGRWVVVDDGSTDATATCLDGLDLPFPVSVVRRENTGGLREASEFAAFLLGAERGLAELPDAERVMKLDADVVLDPGYFAALAGVGPEVGLVSGIVEGLAERERADYTRGALKAYTRPALDAVRRLPVALGFDVLDEVVVRQLGLELRVVPQAVARVTRYTGSGAGLLRGRWRNGVICRWSGYHPLYFALKVLRYVLRRPVGIGALAMLGGFLSAGPGPHDPAVRAEFRRVHRDRLRRLARQPVRELRAAYRGAA